MFTIEAFPEGDRSMIRLANKYLEDKFYCFEQYQFSRVTPTIFMAYPEVITITFPNAVKMGSVITVLTSSGHQAVSDEQRNRYTSYLSIFSRCQNANFSGTLTISVLPESRYSLYKVLIVETSLRNLFVGDAATNPSLEPIEQEPIVLKPGKRIITLED